VVAVSKMKLDGLNSLEARSVKKKLKDKGFAAKVSRADIALGIAELGVSEDEHIDFVIKALRD
jgi:predicted hydrolase (HD superfamily)